MHIASRALRIMDCALHLDSVHGERTVIRIQVLTDAVIISVRMQVLQLGGVHLRTGKHAGRHKHETQKHSRYLPAGNKREEITAWQTQLPLPKRLQPVAR